MNLKLKSNLQFFSAGNGLFHVYDPTSMKHFKIGSQEAGWLRLLNGSHTREQLKAHIPEEFLEKFLEQVEKLGLVEAAGAKMRFDLLKMKFKLFDSNEALTRMGDSTVIARKFLKLSLILFVLLNVFITVYDMSAISGIVTSFTFQYPMIPFYIGAILLIGLLHETAHAVVAKSYGVHVPNIGFMLLYLHPAFYSDISGIHLLTSKRERINTLVAGMITNNMLIAVGLLLFHVTYAFAPGAALYFLLFAVMNTALIMVNVLPFVEYDGYYILMNLFEELNFKSNAKAYVEGLVKHRLHRREIKLEYIFFHVLSRIFMMALLYIAVISLHNLVRHFVHSVYVDYVSLAAMLGLTLYMTLRGRRRKA